MSRSLQVEQNLVIIPFQDISWTELWERTCPEPWMTRKAHPVTTDLSTLLGSWSVTWAVGSHSRIYTDGGGRCWEAGGPL